jgi:7-cyano-7-deazaguanine synthase in queuosine biosynthesis
MKHIVGFSGGIDSQACARWVLNRYPKEDVILLNSDAGGNEHPLTTAFVEEYSRTIHSMVRLQPIINWIDEVVEWAKTDRGGYQFNILRGLDVPSCESKYGLCE